MYRANLMKCEGCGKRLGWSHLHNRYVKCEDCNDKARHKPGRNAYPSRKPIGGTTHIPNGSVDPEPGLPRDSGHGNGCEGAESSNGSSHENVGDET